MPTARLKPRSKTAQAGRATPLPAATGSDGCSIRIRTDAATNLDRALPFLTPRQPGSPRVRRIDFLSDLVNDTVVPLLREKGIPVATAG